MANYDTMQVCLNGHYITDRYYNSPERRQDHCDKCGAETIKECQNCSEEIEGDRLDSSVLVVATPSIPEYCENCGDPYPWTQKPDEEELIERNEGIVSDSVSTETDYLVVDASTGLGERHLAKDHGIPTIVESDLWSLLNNNTCTDP